MSKALTRAIQRITDLFIIPQRQLVPIPVKMQNPQTTANTNQRRNP
jgi:hypothetical protein